MDSQNNTPTPIDVVVIDAWGEPRVVAGESASEGILARTLDVAANIATEPWVVVVGSSLPGQLQQTLRPSRWGGRVIRWLWLYAMRKWGGSPTVAIARRIARAIRQAATSGRNGWNEVAFVVRDAGLGPVLTADDGPALADIERRGSLVGLLTRPRLDPATAPAEWTDDHVRDVEAVFAASPPAVTHGVDPEDLGLLALVTIARMSHAGWAIVPCTVVDREGVERRAALEGQGVWFGEPLAGDPEFCVARLPFGWKVAWSELSENQRLLIVNELGDLRAVVRYTHTSPGRMAQLVV